MFGFEMADIIYLFVGFLIGVGIALLIEKFILNWVEKIIFPPLR